MLKSRLSVVRLPEYRRKESWKNSGPVSETLQQQQQQQQHEQQEGPAKCKNAWLGTGWLQEDREQKNKQADKMVELYI